MSAVDLTKLVQANRRVFREGTTYNKISIGKYLGSCPERHFAYYECSCNVCHKSIIVCNTSMTRSHYQHGCSDCADVVIGQLNTTHGFPKNHKTYKSWCKIKERCFNPNDPDYSTYGARGTTLEPFLKDDFMNFYREVGEAPQDGQRWSIDRIDSSKGYVRGNLQWATDNQQARNKCKSKANTSGVTGVHWDVQRYFSKTLGVMLEVKYAVARWNEIIDGKSKSKNKKFSTTKIGETEAFNRAVKFREDKINELNLMGYGYSEQHGKDFKHE